jgi:hypothetical protein
LSRNKLTDIDFDELIMRIADHRFTSLKFWTEFSMIVEELIRIIKCFESSNVSISESDVSEHYNLLLRLSWLFSVNAVISVRDSKITIEDSALKEITKNIVDFEMIFCTKHILIMYSKRALINTSTATKKQKDENEQESFDDDDSSDHDSFENDLSNIENERHFWEILSMILNCLNQSLRRRQLIH